LSTCRQLWRFFRTARPDIVHTHNSFPLIYGALAARLAGVRRLVHTRHGQRFGATARETVLFGLAARLVTRIICVSQDSRQLSAAEGLPEPRLQTIWNGIDAGRFSYAGPQRDAPVVTVCRLSPEKDVEGLLRAVALVASTDPSFRLRIAGDGPLGPALRGLARELGVETRVEFLGDVKDVAGLLQDASLFVLPSLTEGISLTLLEAMARGLPVVATDVGGNREVVVHGQTGLLVPSGQPARLADAIVTCRRDPDRAVGLGRAGRNRVLAHFQAHRMVRDYENLYREMTAGLRKSLAGGPVPGALVQGASSE
jgi:glycosyltransferase involved in cell wall biosynthesis